MNKRPLVVYLHRYPPEYEVNQFAGMRPMIDQLLLKNDVVYICMKGFAPPSPDIRRGIHVIELPCRVDPTSGFIKYFSTGIYYLMLPLLIYKIKKLKPDLIICKEHLPFIPYLISQLNIPYVITICDFWLQIYLGGFRLGRIIANYLESWEIRRWNRSRGYIVASTQTEAEIITQRGMDKKRIKVIYTAGPRNVFYPCNAAAERKELNISIEEKLFAIHGTIRPGKGYGQLLEWWSRIVQEHPDWHLLIIGGAGGEKWCQNRISYHKLKNNAHMTGWLPSQSDVNRYLNAADCLLVIRRKSTENLGLIPSALYHSMATGKPVVATRLGGISEIITHGVNGFLFEPDSYTSFKGVLEYVITHPEESRQTGVKAMEREKECFSPDQFALQATAYINSILK